MLPELLPTWEEARNAVHSGKGSTLDLLIYEHEGKGIEGVRFRQQLREVLKEASTSKPAQLPTAMVSNPPALQPEFY